MTTPSKLDEARLRELAEAATQGEWHTAATDDSLILRGRTKIASTFALPGDDWGYDNAAFIAAANPATILALLDALSAERERGDRAEARVRDIAETQYPDPEWPRRYASNFLATQKAEGAD